MSLANYEHVGLIAIGVGVFFLIRLAIGYYASRKVTKTEDYVVAGRRLPLHLTGASIMATWFAAETIMGASSSAYQLGFQGVVFDPFGAVLCLLLAGAFFMRLMRRARYITAIDFFEVRYGRAMAVAGAVTQLLAYFGWTAAQIVAGGSIAHALLGVPLPVGMSIVAAVVTFYTMMGGMWADTLLDFMQMFLSAGGILIIFIAVLRHVGGIPGLLANGAARYPSNPWTILPIPSEGYLGYTGLMGIFYWIAAWMSIGFSFNSQDLVQRSMSAKNEAVAVHGSYLAAILYAVFGILSPLIGIAMYTINPNISDAASEYLIVAAATDYLSPILAAVFIAALVSALMSTSDSSMLAGASIVTENLLPLFKPDLDEKAQLRWTRFMVLAMGAGSLGVALYAATIYKLAIFAWTILVVGQAAPYVLGFYWKKANRTGALAGFSAGFGSWLIGLLITYPTTLQTMEDTEPAIWDAAYISSTPAFLIGLIVMIVVSLATYKRDTPMPILDVDGDPLDTTKPFGWLPLRSALHPDDGTPTS